MDFSKLAVTEVRRNPTRTLVAVIASALAAMIVVLLRVVPEGYNVGIAMAERTYSGGDIIIFPAQAPLSSDTPMLIWRSWQGSDSQSHLLYYFPETGSKGYLTEETCTGWRSMIPGKIIESIREIPNVRSISAYRSLPCLVDIDGQKVSAILRGFDLDGYPIDEYLENNSIGDHAFSQANAFEILVPSQIQSFKNIKEGHIISVLVPEPVVTRFDSFDKNTDDVIQTGVSWDEAKQYRFTVSGRYAIKVGEVPDMEAAANSPDPPPMIPIYWKRPEVIIPISVFEEIIKDLNPNPDNQDIYDFELNFPCYQVAVTVNRMSKLRETVGDIRKSLGNDYGVYAVPEALTYAAKSRNHVVMPPDLHSVFSSLIIGFACVVVAGNIYIIVVQQKRKLGLLRVVGATSGNIIQYILTLVAYVSAVGAFSGVIAGNILYLITLIGSDLTIREWFVQALGDFSIIMSLSIGISLAIGFGIAWWASRLPCSEVLSRE